MKFLFISDFLKTFFIINFQRMIALILETIDKFIQYKSRRHFVHYAGEEAASKWDDISSYLYLLLGKKLLILFYLI